MSLPLALHFSAVRGLYLSHGFEMTLDAIADAGYEGVEFSGYLGLPSQQVRSALSHTGLRPVSSFVDVEDLPDDLSEHLDYFTAIGVRYLVCSRREEPCDFPALAHRLASIAEKTAEYGMTFCYHHLAKELSRNPQGGLWLDMLLGPGSGGIHLEVDTYNAERTGTGAGSLLKRYAARCPLLHVCDIRDAETYQRAEIGSGVVNLMRIADLAKAQGAAWFIIDENGPFTDSHDGIRRSASNLRQLMMGSV